MVAEGEEGRAPANDAVAVAAVPAAPPAPPPPPWRCLDPNPMRTGRGPMASTAHRSVDGGRAPEDETGGSYSRCRFPSEKEREEITRLAHLSQVQVWFQNRRQRDANQESIRGRCTRRDARTARRGGMGAAPIVYAMPAMAPGMQVMQYGGLRPHGHARLASPAGAPGCVRRVLPGAEPMAAAQPGSPPPTTPPRVSPPSSRRRRRPAAAAAANDDDDACDGRPFADARMA